MTALDSGPCEPWEPQDCTVFPADTVAVSGVALEAATELLWLRTHRRFGLCSVTFRPCREECWPASSWAYWGSSWYRASWGSGSWGWPFPALIGGVWFNLGCGSCGDSCSCTRLHQIALPGTVAAVTEVKIDGDVLDPGVYRVDNWRYLVRTDGEAWPRCNDLNEPDTEDGTWSVTAQYGEVVPELGKFAVGQLAVEIAKACAGVGGCKLPATVTKSLSRQGVSKEFVKGDLLAGQTGLYHVDLFLNTYNPNRNQPAVIFDIDGSRPRRVDT